MDVTVRRATSVDAAALAAFRLRAMTDESGYTEPDRGAFLEAFSAWFSEHQSTHLAFIAQVDGDVVGMAWLMVAERVPGPRAQLRRCGDVQAVYVAPELRDRGVGATLLEALLAEAGGLGLEHVTVHANDRAVSFYQRAGFDHDPCWLRWQPTS